MMKFLMDKYVNKYGYISVEIVIIVAIILIGGLIGINKYASKGKKTTLKTNETVSKVYKDYGGVDLSSNNPSNNSNNNSSNNQQQTKSRLLDGPSFRTIINEYIYNNYYQKVIFLQVDDISKGDIDLSNNQDKTIMGHVEDNTLMIESKYIIEANPISRAMFHGLPITSVKFDNFDTSIVHNMDAMFSECSSLKEVDMSKFNTLNVQYLGGMFNDCYALEKIDLSNFEIPKLVEMHLMFYGCEKLQELDLTGFSSEHLNSVTHAFNDCTKLEKIYVSDNWVQSFNITYGSKAMFSNNIKLQGKIKFDSSKIDCDMANYQTGYFTYKERK